ncbi:MAG: hypothetical protein HYV61_11185 [Candidatus Rokubacteria bacterium]|nr:hypothetical protein [Candidatus Rokubacteria bacterium]
MTDLAHPAWVYLAGALLAAVVPRRGRVPLLLAVPGAALALGLWLPEGRETAARFLGQEVVLLRADRLSLVFGTVFVIMGLLGTVFALHVRERGPHVAAFAYVGSALGVVFAGDLLTLFVFWELMSVSSAFLILQRRTAKALAAGFRYLMVHAFGGACLLAGLLLRAAAGEGLRFEAMALTGATALILLGFAVNAAIPPLSAWLTDAYPEGTVTGSVFLSAFTTKAAVYALARGFPGVELLVWAGAVMALYGVVFAVLENDIRRLLAYHIVSQVGYMVTGVGLGTALAISGTAAHAFSHILYKGLLFMATGAGAPGRGGVDARHGLRGDVPPHRAQAPVLHLFRGGSRGPPAGAPGEHAPGHGSGGRPLRRHRGRAGVPLPDPPVPGGLRAVHRPPRRHHPPAPARHRGRVHAAGAASRRRADRDPRHRLGVPPGGSAPAGVLPGVGAGERPGDGRPRAWDRPAAGGSGAQARPVAAPSPWATGW